MTIRGRDISVFLILIGQIGPYSVIFFQKIEKLFFKSPCFMAYFVPNFVLIIFLQSILVKSGPTYAKNSKNTNIFEPPLTISLFGPSILSLPNYSLSFPLFVPSILTFSLLFLSFPLFGPSILSTKTVQ